MSIAPLSSTRASHCQINKSTNTPQFIQPTTYPTSFLTSKFINQQSDHFYVHWLYLFATFGRIKQESSSISLLLFYFGSCYCQINLQPSVKLITFHICSTPTNINNIFLHSYLFVLFGFLKVHSSSHFSSYNLC